MSGNQHDFIPGPDEFNTLQEFFKQYRHFKAKAYELERKAISKLLKHFCTIESTDKKLNFCLEIDGVLRDAKIVLKGFQSAQDMYDSKISEILPSLDNVTSYRAKEAYLLILKSRTSLCYLLHRFITGALAANQVTEPIILLAQLHDSQLHQTLCGNDSKASDLCSNTCPILLRPLKRLSMARVLSVVARGRGEASSHKLVAALLCAYSKDMKSKYNIGSTEEGSFSDGSHATSIEICRDLTRNVTPPLPPIATDCSYGKPYSQLFPNYQNPAPTLDPGYLTEQQSVESALVENILKRSLHTENNDLKTNNNNNNCSNLDEIKMTVNSDKVSKAVEYFRRNSWGEVGSVIDSAMLWWMDGRKEVDLLLDVEQVLSPGSEDLPLAFHSPETCLRLRDWLQELTNEHDSLPGVMAAAVQSLCDGMSSHIMTVAWDHSFRMALVQPISFHEDGQSGAEKGTYTGRLFVEVLRRLVSLANDWEDRGTLETANIKTNSTTTLQRDQENYVKEGAYSFSADQIPVLHRLDHSLHTLRMWVQAYTRKAASSWNTLCFFQAAHTDVTCALDVLKHLRLPESEDISEVKSVNVTVCVKMRAKLVSEVKANIAKLQALPGECLTVLSMMGRTVSLATLCLCMPEARYWRRRNNALPEFPSSYVEEYLDKVLKPVIKAVQHLELQVQQSAAGMVLRILGESWLDHIYQHRIKFSEWGALQLLTDFGSVHSWIEERISVSPELRRHLAQTEVLRRCEGVGRLLLRHPGEAISMVPPSRGTSNHRRGGSGEGSPISSTAALGPLMPAEMYVPNQEQWLELRASGAQDQCRDCCCPCWPPLFCALCLMSCR